MLNDNLDFYFKQKKNFFFLIVDFREFPRITSSILLDHQMLMAFSPKS